jgi:hypothetical protein
LPVTIVMRESDGVDYSRFWFYLGWWPLIFIQEWWAHIWYVVYGSLDICHWRELAISRILGHNQDLRYPGY